MRPSTMRSSPSLTLTSIPPELLLQIISHLPSPSTLHALALTSHHLSTFIHTHAATICNTRIKTHPLHSHAAEILKAEYVDGWLVPSLPCVREVEEAWMREVTSRSGSRAASPVAGGLRRGGMTGCCFRTDSAGSGSSASRNEEERAPRPRVRMVSAHRPHSQPRGKQIRRQNQELRCHHPQSQIQTQTQTQPSTRHTDLSLSLTLGLPMPFKLSRPGPHFLVFLERYSAEVVARWEMCFPSTSSLNNMVKKRNESGDQQGDEGKVDLGAGERVAGDANDEKKEKEEDNEKHKQFQSGLKLYCLRNWLVLCNNTFITGDGEGNGVPYAHLSHPTYPEAQSGTRTKLDQLFDDARSSLQKTLRKGKKGIEKTVQSLNLFNTINRKGNAKPTTPTTTRRLLFGEIDTSDSDSTSLLVPEQSSDFGGRTLQHRSTGSTDATAVERERAMETWVKGLLWFYGVGAGFGHTAPQMVGVGLQTLDKGREGENRNGGEEWSSGENGSGRGVGGKVAASWERMAGRLLPGRRRFEKLVVEKQVDFCR